MDREIYRINKGKIEVFNLKPRIELIAFFRDDEIKKIPENERVLLYKDKKSIFDKKSDIIYQRNNYVLKKTTDEENRVIIQKNLLDVSNPGEIRRLKRTDNEEYILLLDLLFDYKNKRIQITPDLCNELLLEKEDYDSYCLDLNRLSRIKNLFKLSDKPVYKIDIKEVKKYFDSDMYDEYMNGTFEEEMYYLESSTKVYEKLK